MSKTTEASNSIGVKISEIGWLAVHERLVKMERNAIMANTINLFSASPKSVFERRKIKYDSIKDCAKMTVHNDKPFKLNRRRNRQ